MSLLAMAGSRPGRVCWSSAGRTSPTGTRRIGGGNPGCGLLTPWWRSMSPVQFVAAAHRIDSATLVNDSRIFVVLRTFLEGLPGWRGCGSDTVSGQWGWPTPVGDTAAAIRHERHQPGRGRASYLAESATAPANPNHHHRARFLRARLADFYVEHSATPSTCRRATYAANCDQDSLRVRHPRRRGRSAVDRARSSTDAVPAALGSGWGHDA